jgi:hypothetical protein
LKVAIGGIGVPWLFGIIALRDAEIAIGREPARRHDRLVIEQRSESPQLCELHYLWLQQ